MTILHGNYKTSWKSLMVVFPALHRNTHLIFLSRALCPLSYRHRASSTHIVGSNATCFHRSFCEPTTFLRCLMLIFLAKFNTDTWSGGDFVLRAVVSSVTGKICLRIMIHLGFSHDASVVSPTISDTNRPDSDTNYKAFISGDFNPVSEQQSDVVKSVKADNAAVPIDLWNKLIFAGSRFGVEYEASIHDTPLEIIREHWAMRWYRKRLFHSFRLYMRKAHGANWVYKLVSARHSPSITNIDIRLDAKVGCDALSRAIDTSWWTWDLGSTLLFWRWPNEVVKEARDGSRLPWKFFPMPAYKVPQKHPKNKLEKDLMIQKVRVPIDRGYIAPGSVRSLSGFFGVPKGPIDIRLVYDMTKCGLNKCLWSPRFYVSCPDSLFYSIEYDSFMSDIDQGEMFLNYFSDPELLPYMGVDVTEAVMNSEHETGNKHT